MIEKYDTEGRMLGGQDDDTRNRVRSFIHAAEGTFMVHALAIMYARWFAPPSISSSDLKQLEEGMAVNVGKDLDWLESELQGRKFLAGDMLTAADTVVLFSLLLIFKRDLCAGRGVVEWPAVRVWMERCESTESWRRAVEKTGFEM